MRVLTAFEDGWRELRWAWRSLRRTPGFTTVAFLTLALGIGANAAVFSTVRGVLLEPLPYRSPQQLVRVVGALPAPANAASATRRGPGLQAADLPAFRRQATLLDGVMVWIAFPATMTGGPDGPVRLDGVRVSPDMFPMLDAAPLAGRTFGPDAEASGADGSVVLSQALWQRQFAGAADVIGRTITLDGRGYTVVGIMPAGFAFPDALTQFWVPFVPADLPNLANAPIVRIKDGVSREAARQQIRAVAGQLWAAHPATGPRPPAPVDFDLIGLQDELVAPVRPALLVLSGAVALVLLIACVNLANLLLARSAARRREMAVLLAVGASRRRVILHALGEAALLAIGGGALGTGIAIAAVRLLKLLAAVPTRRDLGPGLTLPRLDQIRVDGGVLLYVAAISIAAGVLFGLAPAIVAFRRESFDALRDGTSSGSAFGRRGRPSAQGPLIVAEVGMAIMLFVGGGLLIRSLINLSRVDAGYDPAHLLTAQVTLPRGRYSESDVAAFGDALAERLRQLPGVAAAGYARQLPMVRMMQISLLRMTPEFPPGMGAPPAPGQQLPPESPDTRLISRGFLDAMGVRTVDGRGLEAGDAAGGPQVMLINQTLARSGYLGDHPIGRQLYLLGLSPWEVVGVVEDVREGTLDRAPDPQVFIDYRQMPAGPRPPGAALMGPPPAPYVAIRTADAATVVPALRRLVRDLEPQATVDNVAEMSDLVSYSTAGQRLFAVLLGIFAAVAVVLAAVGIYGVLAYAVTQRTREIGIRVALGAPRDAVVRLIVRQAALLTCLGIVAGLAGAAALSRYLRALLFGLTPVDPATYAGVAIGFAAIAALAAYLPARRAARVDPLIALRCE